MSTGTPALPRIRASLEESRDRGEAFATAWSLALAAVRPSSEARAILSDTRLAWRRAYLGRPATAGDRAAGELAQALTRDRVVG